jgi:hypothetical protein
LRYERYFSTKDGAWEKIDSTFLGTVGIVFDGAIDCPAGDDIAEDISKLEGIPRTPTRMFGVDVPVLDQLFTLADQ